MRTMRGAVGRVVATVLLASLALIGWAVSSAGPSDTPWTPLDLGQRVGVFTGRKLTALTGDFATCRALLDQAGVRYTPLPVREDGPRCGYADGVRLIDRGSRRAAFVPSGLRTACPVAAALSVWEWNVVQPAAIRIFGSPVAAIDHFGSYSCRRIYGRAVGAMSEHATADAVDIAGFRLANGTRITVRADWRGDGAKAAFLHTVRDGACTVFATTLSPDYNTAHHDHLHLDQANRGAMGWRACR